MVRRTEVERVGGATGKIVRQASVESHRHDIARKVSGLARADIDEPGQQDGAHGIVVTDDRRGLAMQRGGDARELPAIEKLAVREMDIGECDVAHLDDLCTSPRQAAR